MDPIVRGRLLSRIVVHPFLKVVGGDKTFGVPYTLNGYVNYREKVVLTPLGSESQFYTYVIFDGNEPTPDLIADIVGFIDIHGNVLPIVLTSEGVSLGCVTSGSTVGSTVGLIQLGGSFVLRDGSTVQFALIKSEDEIELPGQGQIPVKTVRSYQGLTRGTQNVEVII